MHGDILTELATVIRDRATNVAWAQWAALGSGAVAPRAPVALVDPEALVLASLGLVDHERRLADLLAWWSVRGSGLLSVQRMRNLSVRYPDPVRHRLKEFAAYARAAGDHRWKALAGKAETGVASTTGGEPRLDGAAATLLRLRLGMGVGIKADIVAAMLGAEGWWTVRELAVSTAYTARAVRRAAEDLARGGWVTASPATPAEYRADRGRWLPFLALETASEWRDWHGLYALLLAVDAWLRSEEWRDQTLEEAERAARRLVDGHRAAFKWAEIAVPRPESRPGAEYIRAFAEALDQVTRRMEQGV